MNQLQKSQLNLGFHLVILLESGCENANLISRLIHWQFHSLDRTQDQVGVVGQWGVTVKRFCSQWLLMPFFFLLLPPSSPLLPGPSHSPHSHSFPHLPSPLSPSLSLSLPPFLCLSSVLCEMSCSTLLQAAASMMLFFTSCPQQWTQRASN